MPRAPRAYTGPGLLLLAVPHPPPVGPPASPLLSAFLGTDEGPPVGAVARLGEFPPAWTSRSTRMAPRLRQTGKAVKMAAAPEGLTCDREEEEGGWTGGGSRGHARCDGGSGGVCSG
ncbi:unnamed protein product [Pleuronectes platessa]|uniref:Uncharacterized protein n=1 Tax=Pleuronectes platessa TaxID=8262 RepID=A0A9N7YMV5_PLEPL|nr:unnamed protein product [Pleuronectes platessa]